MSGSSSSRLAPNDFGSSRTTRPIGSSRRSVVLIKPWWKYSGQTEQRRQWVAVLRLALDDYRQLTGDMKASKP